MQCQWQPSKFIELRTYNQPHQQTNMQNAKYKENIQCWFLVFSWTLAHTRVFKTLFLWKLAHTRGNVFSHRHLHKKTSNFFLVKMANLWRWQLFQQLQDNLDDDGGEELFLLELYTCLHLTSQKFLDDMVGPHLNNKKNCPKIGNKAINEFTMIIMHLH
jgi:hypothetical protein